MSKLPTMTGVKSSHVEAIGWEGDALYVRFKGGGVYHYQGVPKQIFHDGLEADSPGTWFRSHVSGRFPHTKLGKADAQSHDR